MSEFNYVNVQGHMTLVKKIGRNHYKMRWPETKDSRELYVRKRKGKWTVTTGDGNYWSLPSNKGLVLDLLKNVDNWIAETILLGEEP